MHAVWREIVLNMFYFESEEAKQVKLAEEDWESAHRESPLKRKHGEIRALLYLVM